MATDRVLEDLTETTAPGSDALFYVVTNPDSSPLGQKVTKENLGRSLPTATTSQSGAMSASDKAKLDGIEAGAQANTVDSVNGATGTVVLDADDIDDSATANRFTTAADISKLAGIEAGADVTDATNVAAAGALMVSQNLADLGDVPTAQQNLSLEPGVDVQAYDAELAALAGLTSAANKVPRFTGAGTADLLDFKDEDDMASDSATAVPSQQSVKAYVDAHGLIGRGYVESNTEINTTLQIPTDNTIPQSTEGAQILSTSYTVKSASSRVRITAVVPVDANTIGLVSGALFAGASADAVASVAVTVGASNQPMFLMLQHEYVPGSTGAVTFAVRIGLNTAGNAYANRRQSGSMHGGVLKSTMVIEEIAA